MPLEPSRGVAASEVYSNGILNPANFSTFKKLQNNSAPSPYLVKLNTHAHTFRKGGDIDPKIFIKRFLICCRKNFGDFYWILIGWFIEMCVQTFTPLIVIYIRISFVHPIIYQPLSYPFRSLIHIHNQRTAQN